MGVAKAKRGEKRHMWYDDPIFDDTEEVVDGKRFRGDDWRRLMRVKEANPAAKVISVAGVTYRRAAIEKMTSSTAILVPEPDNKHDPNAIRVEVGGQHVGYVPRGASVSPQHAPVMKWGVDPPFVWIAVY
jgi:hypothetical protein